MTFEKILGIKEKFRKGNDNIGMRKLFDQERPVITVAQDGTGDYQKIEDALKLLKQIGGGTMIIKKGNYFPAVYSSENYLDCISNLRIDGGGVAELFFPYPEANLSKTIMNFRGKKNIIIENLILNIPNEWSTETTATTSSVFKIGNSENIILENNIYKQYATGQGKYAFDKLIDCDANSISGMKLLKNDLSKLDGGMDNYFIDAGNLKNCIIKENNLALRNWMDGYPNFTDSIISGNYGIDGAWTGKYINCKIKDNQATGDTTILRSGSILSVLHGNKFSSITIAAGSNYNNVTGNLVDSAVTNNGTGNTVANNTVY